MDSILDIIKEQTTAEVIMCEPGEMPGTFTLTRVTSLPNQAFVDMKRELIGLFRLAAADETPTHNLMSPEDFTVKGYIKI